MEKEKYIVIRNKRYTITELETMGVERLKEFKQIKSLDSIIQSDRIKEYMITSPFEPGTIEFEENLFNMKRRLKFLNFDIAELNRIIKKKNHEFKDEENKLCYRFYCNAKELLSPAMFEQIEKAAKEEMILKGEFI